MKILQDKKNFRKRVEMIKTIAKEYGRKKGATELAQQFGVSKQRIEQLVCDLRKRGIDIPRIKIQYTKAIEIAIKELKDLK